MKKLLCMMLFAVLFVAGWSYREYRPWLEVQAKQARVSVADASDLPEDDDTTLSSSTPSAANAEDWNLVLVNYEYPLEKPLQIKQEQVGNFAVDARIADSLTMMLRDAQEQGIHLNVMSGYRTFAQSQALYQSEIDVWIYYGYTRAQATELAAMLVAPPGTSEHHTGLAVDILSKDYYIKHGGRFEASFSEDPEGIWLRENCMNYGFILRYPEDKTEITGKSFEPWHFRYVGTTHAKYIMENGLCLEEYLNTAAEDLGELQG